MTKIERLREELIQHIAWRHEEFKNTEQGEDENASHWGDWMECDNPVCVRGRNVAALASKPPQEGEK